MADVAVQQTETEPVTFAHDDAFLAQLAREKQVAVQYQARRHEAWREIYQLYRDIVPTNEVTQRQEVNIPMMKETKKTLMSRIDDPPAIVFDCLEQGEKGREKEQLLNEMWQQDYDTCFFEGVDHLEKNNVLLYGRAVKQLNMVDSEFKMEVCDNISVVLDPKMNPLDVETARFIIRLHIFKPLRQILADDRYEEAGKQKLKHYLDEQIQELGEGHLVEFNEDEAKKSLDDLLRDLNIDNYDDMGGAEITVELNQHLTLKWDTEAQKYVRYLVIVAANNAILYQKPLKEALGIDFWPVITWADDPDTRDLWTDGMGDVVRIPNKVANVYFSTMLENRVYRNLGMSWFIPAPGYDPQTFEPEPFGQYPAPLVTDKKGNIMSIEQVIKQMDIPALDDNLVSINFLIQLVERATAATAIEKGVSERKNITLGEVEELIQKSSERIVNIAKFYRRAWKETAWKWLKMREHSGKAMELFKKGPKGGYFKKKVSVKDWQSKNGWRVRVQTSSEQEAEELESLQKIAYARQQFPENPALRRIAQTKILDHLNLSPQEIQEVEDAEKTIQSNINQGGQAPSGGQPTQGGEPALPKA